MSFILNFGNLKFGTLKSLNPFIFNFIPFLRHKSGWKKIDWLLIANIVALVLVGLISNCFSEEAAVIRRSVLYPYFDAPLLSWEEGLQKPDETIFRRCVERLGTSPDECLYVGDGGG